jgi:hypothetical protein
MRQSRLARASVREYTLTGDRGLLALAIDPPLSDGTQAEMNVCAE